MKTAIITGSGGLIGSESVRFFSKKFDVIGIDNNMRKFFFGNEASTEWNQNLLKKDIENYEHHNCDIRDVQKIEEIFKEENNNIKLVIHTAAQPSHDWASSNPSMDFDINARGTLNMLEMTRKHCPDSTFIYTSTNKVYGDTPNSIPLIEWDTRYEPTFDHPYYQNGIPETMSIDQSKHSLFGVSKLSGDLLCQEYARYFNLKTGIFRGGCLTGPNHSGTQLHGFLSYLSFCSVNDKPYTIFGYKGKQVRDNIHSSDLVSAFNCFYRHPRKGEVYNLGGSRHSNCSMMEAIKMCEDLTGKKMKTKYVDDNRSGDHIWWISDVSKFKSHYPKWNYKYGMKEIMSQLYERFSGSKLASGGTKV